jgi:tetratricopeptide (TPR) repeat protein
LIYAVTSGYIEYSPKSDFKKNATISLFLEESAKVNLDDYFLFMMRAYFLGQKKEVYKYFNLYLDWLRETTEKESRDEGFFVDFMLEPLKNAYPGFWKYVQKETKDFWKDDSTYQLCGLMSDIYERSSDEEAVDKITGFIQVFPDVITAREYLGELYCNLKMWNNAIAAFESIEEPVLFAVNEAAYYIELALCYGAVKDYKNEELYYRKGLDAAGTHSFLLNNLGFCLYKQKKYLDAKDIFEQCLKEERDLPYAANNYVRTLIALGRNKDAKDFLKQDKYKIIKSLKDKVKKLPSTNKRLGVKQPEPDIQEDEAAIAPVMEPALSRKAEQFSNERILEDELTSRIERGLPVFGKQLKVYKRKGEYGRQYIIPVGRLDLLCEDNDGELYIIELKKDGGYDDVYEQIVKYINWFSDSEKFKDRKINGIICLNSPSSELINKIRSDDKVRLFEYQISYTEIR